MIGLNKCGESQRKLVWSSFNNFAEGNKEYFPKAAFEQFNWGWGCLRIGHWNTDRSKEMKFQGVTVDDYRNDREAFIEKLKQVKLS